MDNLVLGVDIGGSHITAALVNVSSGVLLNETLVRTAVDPEGTADEIITAWSVVISKALSFISKNNILIGIAMPGPFDYKEGISLIKEQKKFRSLYGLNVKKLLAGKLSIDNYQIHFLNDACSFLHGEILGGAIKGIKNAIGITLGTGLGSAFYINGDCSDAALWDMQFKEGIVEDYISTRWFTKEFEGRYGIPVKGVKEMIGVIKEDSSKAVIFEDFGKNLALFLIELYKKTNVDTIVLGGNISKTSDHFLAVVHNYLQQADIKLDIRTSEIGEAAILIGAAGDAYEQLAKQIQHKEVKA